MERELAKIRRLSIYRDAKMAAYNAALQELTRTHGKPIDVIDGKINEAIVRVEAWANENRALWQEKQSLDTPHATVGWRLGGWKCAKLMGWTWERKANTAPKAKIVLEKIKSLPAMADYIRTSEEVDKAAIIADRDVFTADALAAIGVKVIQEESFFVEPKGEELATVKA